MNLKPKYFLTCLMGVGAFYCAYSPSVCSYTENMLTLLGESDQIFDFKTAHSCMLWLSNFLFFMPVIIGQLADTIGIVSMIIPSQAMVLCGQFIMMICYHFAQRQYQTYLVSFLGYFFISIGFEGVKLTQLILIANTFIRVDGNLIVFQRIAIVSFILNGIFRFGSIFWSYQGADLMPAETFGFLLSLVCLVMSWFIVSSDWIKNNTEDPALDENSKSLLWSHNDKAPIETFSYLNERSSDNLEFKSSRASTKLRNLGIPGVVIMFGYSCYVYLLDKIAFYYPNAFSFDQHLGFIAQRIVNVIPGLLLLTVQMLCLFFFHLSKVRIERMVLASCTLLAISVLLIKITGLYSPIVFTIAAAVHPYALLLYLPHIVNKKIKDAGFVLGLFIWVEAFVNSIGIGLAAKYDNDTAILKNFNWGNQYFRVLVISYLSAMIVSLGLFTYRIYIQQKRLMRETNSAQEKNDRYSWSQNTNSPMQISA